jgi:ADP-ribose pyrophosphatase YjhB (NUDIX family)
VRTHIDLTVAAVVEENGKFLLVEELAHGQQVFNQPAGHVEPGESLLDAAVRETREETGFHFRPNRLLGIYLWQHPDSGRCYLRIAFKGTALAPAEEPTLDDGILAVHWLSPREMRQCEPRMRSPMVLQCVDDYLSGTGYPLDALVHLLPEYERAAKRA